MLDLLRVEAVKNTTFLQRCYFKTLYWNNSKFALHHALCVYIKYKKYDAISSVAKNFLTAFDAVVNLEGRR